ncbi:hypothetical protein [Echinicola shivajiensis]|uniref:hypothetical protein n=1 Tax=Echinicola shivajiensis TaxID=1035916 RepID=UPI001BFBFA2E|nr:hypothetical protein [Echinicola shivajiensis]
MEKYVVNNRQQTNGDHEVHKEGCRYFPSDYQYLGEHYSCGTAVARARQIYPTANGCKTCSNACHTS